MKLKQHFILFIVFGMILLSGCSLSSSKDKEPDNDTKKQEEAANGQNEQDQEDTEKNDTDANEDAAKDDENAAKDQDDEANKDTDDSKSDTENANTDANTTFEGISFALPEIAEQIDIPDQGMPAEAYILNEEDGTNFNVIVETLPSALSLDTYIELATAQTGFDYESIENYSSNGMEWNEAISKNEGYKLNQRTFVVDDKAYIFSFASSDGSYDEFLPVFEDITKSVVVND
ncbi:hypothetical protein [Bacillus niameyensis]|uniref:hypothetical protein n=1 Tax=Bacillus niameyensis TaxID=1522308 RepID=UPI000782D02C|nr:hypothetical protein [Bacillus niameyensis]